MKHFVQEECAGGETREGRQARNDQNDSATPGTRVMPTEGTERVQEECANEKQQVVRPGQVEDGGGKLQEVQMIEKTDVPFKEVGTTDEQPLIKLS